MYLTEIHSRSKNTTYRCFLLRETYREGGKVKNRTLANLSHGKPGEIEAIRLALAHKGDLTMLGSLPEAVEVREGLSIGAVWLVYQVARRLGIERALGTQRAGKMALWQVMARVIDQGSRLSAVRLAQTHAACDILGLRGFDENDLYENLGWLADHQRAIEKRLFRARRARQKPRLFFYDVTSSYLEGECNELAAWGYNRDKKAGKQQIVIGLLGDEGGEPVATEVFQGNTLDFATLGVQVKKIAEMFECQEVTVVGDRGMLKSEQIEALKRAGFHYITALTKGQIRALLALGVLHLEAFGEQVGEVTEAEIRYVLRRNPQRAAELAATRRAKRGRIERELTKQNRYLAEHRRARVDTALKAIQNHLTRLRLEKWLTVGVEGRGLQLEEDSAALVAESRLDGGYVLKSDLTPAVADRHTIHDRYKALAEVERAFRTCQTGHLEVRPVFVRTEESTRGHVLVVMLAYLIVRYLRRAWAALDLTVEEGIAQLATLCSLQVGIKGQSPCHRLPIPRESSVQLLKAAGIRLPKALPSQGARVVSRKQLPSHRPRP
jgi:Transposase DDE domain